MLIIRLFCAAGLSTSMLMEEMKKAAIAENKEIDIKAYPISQLKEKAINADVILLGPQISYEYEKSKKICDALGKPISVIPSQDYGMMNGKAVLNLAYKLFKGEKNEKQS